MAEIERTISMPEYSGPPIEAQPPEFDQELLSHPEADFLHQPESPLIPELQEKPLLEKLSGSLKEKITLLIIGNCVSHQVSSYFKQRGFESKPLPQELLIWSKLLPFYSNGTLKMNPNISKISAQITQEVITLMESNLLFYVQPKKEPSKKKETQDEENPWQKLAKAILPEELLVSPINV